MMYRVLFVCTANICRSPLAEAILQKKIVDAGLSGQMEAASCGILAMDGHKACQASVEVAAENGLDLSRHCSNSITAEDLRFSNLILTMTPEHRDEIFNYYSKQTNKVFTLRGYLMNIPPVNETIDDPYGLTLNFYRRIYQEIETEISRIFPDLRKIVQKNISA